jgi:hypothetical protein
MAGCVAALCFVWACERAGFESLGALIPPPVRFEPRDAGQPLPPTEVAGSSADAVPDAALSAAAGAAGGPAAGSGGGAGASGASGAGGAGGAKALDPVSGTLGTTPFNTKVGYVVGRSDELGTTTLYLIDSSVTCQQISSLAWLNDLPSSVHVIEIAFQSTAATGTTLTSSLVSYAKGGSYSFTKARAMTSSLLLTQNKPAIAVDGTLSATFASGSVMGAFHAAACATGMTF